MPYWFNELPRNGPCYAVSWGCGASQQVEWHFIRNTLAFSNNNVVRNSLSLKCKNNFKLGTDQHEITPDKLSKSLTSSISCANIILFLLDMPTPGQWRLLSCEVTLNVVAMALHDCAVLIAPQGYWDLFPPVWWFLWLCTHGTSAPARMLVRRNVAGIWSVWDLPAFAGIAGIGESTVLDNCAVPVLGWILLTRGLKRAKAVFRPFCIHF